MAKRLAIVLGLLVWTAVACAHASGPGTSGTGIRGLVTIGPTCPVENAESPCPPRPFDGTVRATGTGGEVAEARTDSEGRFVLDLKPGTYTVIPVTPTPPFPSASPVTVVVTAGGYTRVTLQMDSGIR